MIANEIWLDPTEEEAAQSEGTLILACMPALGTTTNVWQTGQMSITDTMKVGTALFTLVAFFLMLLIHISLLSALNSAQKDVSIFTRL
jgi:hypothetical protein